MKNSCAKLRKIEALFAGAGTIGGERGAAEAASESLEYKFSLTDSWSRYLFTALCRRYDLKPFRYQRQKYTTVMVSVPKVFVDENVLWPEFEAFNQVLTEYLDQATIKIISEEVHRDTTEEQEQDKPLAIAAM